MKKHFAFFFRRGKVSLVMFNCSLLGLDIRRNKDTGALSLFLKIENTGLTACCSLQNWLAYFPSPLVLSVRENTASTYQTRSLRL